MVAGNKRDLCKLCEGEGPLLKSHILPEFLYETLYDDKHRYIGISPDPKSKNPFKQQGLQEYLLCISCERRFSVWETYSAGVLRKIPDTTSAKPGDILEVRGVDYTKFKLFQLSLLWRAGVASHPTFSEADLGPHLEKLRRLLNAEEPADRAKYGCVLIGFHGGKVDRVGRPPIRHRLDGHRSVIFLMAGLFWVFVVSSHTDAIKARASFLGEEGILRIHIGTLAANQFLAALGAALKKEGLI